MPSALPAPSPLLITHPTPHLLPCPSPPALLPGPASPRQACHPPQRPPSGNLALHRLRVPSAVRLLKGLFPPG